MHLKNLQKNFTTTHLIVTIFQPLLKSTGTGVTDRFGRGTVYEVLAVAGAV